MSKISSIVYYWDKTIKENAEINECSEAAIRYYIKVRGIVRAWDERQKIIRDIHNELVRNPNVTNTEIKNKTGFALSTIRKYIKIAREPFVYTPKVKPVSQRKIGNIKIPCVYLMKDLITGDTKIGESIDVLNREKTLQADKPQIELFYVLICDTKKEAQKLEKHLHSRYAAKHKRGEWYTLTNNDISQLLKEYKWVTEDEYIAISKDEKYNECNDAYDNVTYNCLIVCREVENKIKYGEYTNEQLNNIIAFFKSFKQTKTDK